MVAVWLPLGAYLRGSSGRAETQNASEGLGMRPNGPVTFPIRAVTRARSDSCGTFANTQHSSAYARGRWWLQRDSNPCFSLERADTYHKPLWSCGLGAGIQRGHFVATSSVACNFKRSGMVEDPRMRCSLQEVRLTRPPFDPPNA